MRPGLIQELRYYGSTRDFDTFTKLLDEVPNNIDPVSDVHVRVWKGLHLSQTGKSLQALTEWNYAFRHMTTDAKSDIVANNDCCFDLVYGVSCYVNSSAYHSNIDMAELVTMVDAAAEILRESQNTQWMDIIHYSRAEIAARLTEDDEAITHFQNWVKHYDTNAGMTDVVSAKRSYAGYYQRRRLFEDALRVLDGIDKQVKNEWERFEIGVQFARCHFELDDLDTAVKRLRELPYNFAPPATLKLKYCGVLIDVRLAQGLRDEAIEALEDLQRMADGLDENVYTFWAAVKHADVMIADGKLDEARTALEALQPDAEKLDATGNLNLSARGLTRRLEKIANSGA